MAASIPEVAQLSMTGAHPSSLGTAAEFDVLPMSPKAAIWSALAVAGLRLLPNHSTLPVAGEKRVAITTAITS